MFNARFFVLGFFLATFIFTLVSAAYAFMFVSTVVSGAPAYRTLAKRRLSRFARLPFLFAYSDLAVFFFFSMPRVQIPFASSSFATSSLRFHSLSWLPLPDCLVWAVNHRPPQRL
jgi:hypothetical protein